MKTKFEYPKIDDVNQFSQYVGVSTKYINRIINGNISKYYRHFNIKKRSGKYREISAPLPTLNIIQYWVKNNILDHIKVSKYAKAYVKGVSLKDNVRFHKNQEVVLKLDIENFFNNIRRIDVYKIFRKIGYSKLIASLLANITTIGSNGIPQGAVTSPVISNLILYDFDEWMGKYIISLSKSKKTKVKLRYTRYADDITISGNLNKNIEDKIISKIKKKLETLNLYLNVDKCKSIKRFKKQQVTGITVNEVLNVNKQYRQNLRLELHYFLLPGNSDNHLQRVFETSQISSFQREYYIRSLIGKINYILSVNGNNKSFFVDAKKKLLKM